MFFEPPVGCNMKTQEPLTYPCDFLDLLIGKFGWFSFSMGYFVHRLRYEPSPPIVNLNIMLHLIFWATKIGYA